MSIEKCNYCHSPDNQDIPICTVRKDGFVCTRDPKHQGDHIACSMSGHELRKWTQ